MSNPIEVEIMGMKVHCAHLTMLPIEDFHENPNNPNDHSESQIERLAKLFKYEGIRHPIIVSKRTGFIAAGHGRLMAAKKLEMSHYPVDYQDFDSHEQEMSFVVSDNAIALWAELDFSKINAELAEFDPEFDLENLGIKNFKIDGIEPELNEDEIPGTPVEPKSKRGEIYILGNHRVMCGDSTMIDDVEKLMNGEKAHMIFTDPPYGVNFEQGKNISREKKTDRDFEPIANDDKQGDDLKDFVQQALLNAALVSDVCVIYVWSPPLLEGSAILKAVMDSGWHVQSQIIWNKTPFVIGRADYHWKHEVCWYGYKGVNHQWFGNRDKATVWDVPKTQSSDSHPTMKPVELGEIACNNSTKEGDVVLDLFGGSGSTLIACEKTNRRCFIMELEPRYVDVIIERFENLTKQKAELLQ